MAADPNPRAPSPALDTDGRGSANEAVMGGPRLDPDVEAVTEAFEADGRQSVERPSERDASARDERGEGPVGEGEH